jgi:hypothetical protein
MPSPYAVVLVPARLLETLEPAGTDLGGNDAAASDTGPGDTDEKPYVTPLPQRRSRRDQAAGPSPASAAAAVSSDPSGDVPTPAEAGAWMGSYLGGSAEAAEGGDAGA